MEQKKGVILVTVALLPERLSIKELETIKAHSGGREVLHATETAVIQKNLDRIEIIIADPPWDLMAKMPNLKWFQAWSAGVDPLQTRPELAEHPVVITNTSGIHKTQITEHVFALILTHIRCLPEVLESQKKHEWHTVRDHQVRTLPGAVMLILGYGAIGRKLAEAAHAFGMKVIGLRRKPDKAEDGPVQVEPAENLHRLLGGADYVVNILPFTAETRLLMGAEEFGLMKKNAVYINVGRGSTTDEAAMIDALKSGRLGAALLDVFDKEPLPPDSPLWDMENVIVSPHYAGMHPEYTRLAMEVTIENLDRYNRGEKLINIIDKKAGY